MAQTSILQATLAGRSDIHILRKLWHMSTGSLGLYIYMNVLPERKLWGFITLAIAIIGFSTDILRMKNEKFNNLMIKFMGPLMRSSEKDGFSGLPFYALGVSLSLLLFKEKIALLAIMFLVFSDPISSFFGICFGKDKILPNKSLQGSLAGFCTCYLLTLFYILQSPASAANIFIYAVFAGLIGSFSELVSAFNIDDNLTIPVISGVGLTFMNYFLNVF